MPTENKKKLLIYFNSRLGTTWFWVFCRLKRWKFMRHNLAWASSLVLLVFVVALLSGSAAIQRGPKRPVALHLADALSRPQRSYQFLAFDIIKWSAFNAVAARTYKVLQLYCKMLEPTHEKPAWCCALPTPPRTSLLFMPQWWQRCAKQKTTKTTTPPLPPPSKEYDKRKSMRRMEINKVINENLVCRQKALRFRSIWDGRQCGRIDVERKNRKRIGRRV